MIINKLFGLKSWRSTFDQKISTMRVAGILSLIALLLAACGGNPDPTTQTAPPVNGFGAAINHPHSLVAFPNKVLLLTTHYGLYRSENNGVNWTMVAAGPDQLMDGMMTYSLAHSLFDEKKLYVLAQPSIAKPKGIPGLYRSSDQGKTWEIASSAETLTNSNIYLAAVGNDHPDQVYIYLNTLGSMGLKVSMDSGEHFTTTGQLPFATLTCLLPLPGKPGVLLAGSNTDGLARSTDGGLTWEKIAGIEGGVFEITTTGPDHPIYASGDAGVYASKDGGETFELVYSESALNALSASPTKPETIYGKTGTAIFRSTDGGKTWEQLSGIKGNFFNLEADPTNPAQVYLSLSYPTELYHFEQSGSWTSLTPKL